jgi:hypothetical protein
MLKRLSFLLSIILLVGLVVGVGWFIRYRNTVIPDENIPGDGSVIDPGQANAQPNASSSQPQNGSSTTIVVPPQKPFGLVADQEVAAYYPYPDGSVAIIQPSGQVMKINGTDGVLLSSLGISNLSHAAFSFDGKKIVATFGNPLNLQVSVFDLDRKSWEPVFARPSSPPLWSPNDYRLVFLTNSQEGSAITLIDMQAKTPKTQDLLSLGGEDLVLAWKSKDELFITEKSSAFSSSQLFSYDLKKKTVASVISDWPGLDLAWNTRLQEGVIFQANKNAVGGKMSLIGSDGVVARQFSFVSLPREKCLFGELEASATLQKSSTTSSTAPSPQPAASVLLCAVPKNTTRFLNAFLPDDYLQKDIMTEDSIVEVGLTTGDVNDLSRSMSEAVDATNLKATAGSVYFINRFNNKLYRLSRG